MIKTFRNGAIALTLISGAALFAVPTSANMVTHGLYLGDGSSAGVTNVHLRRYHRHYYAPPAYYAPPPDYYYGPSFRYYGPGPSFSVDID